MQRKPLRLIAVLCIVTVLCSLLPAAALAADISELQITGVINCSKLKLRAAPSSEARVLDTYSEGEKVIVLRNDGTWCQVTLDDKTGYMMTKFLDITTPYVSQGFARTSESVTFVNLYTSPDETSNIAWKFLGGAVVEIVDEDTEWSKVRSGSVIGYIQNSLLTKVSDNLQVFTYIGENNPYAWKASHLPAVQELGSGKGMSKSRGEFTSTVRYPVLALGIADAVISSYVHNWTSAAETDYEVNHSGQSAQLTIDYSADKLDDNYASIVLSGTYAVTGHNDVHFNQALLIDLVTGDVINTKDIITNSERIAFQLEVCMDQVFGSYVEEYCCGITEQLIEKASITANGIEFFFNAGEILPLHLGAQHITMPFYRTYDYITLDTPFVANNSRLIDPAKPMIALTFDDGPSEETLRIVAELEKYNSRGTFCVVGSRLDAYESVLRATVASGQEIANHTWNHRNLEEISADKARYQISSVNEAVYDMTGFTIRVLRPPYGANNKRVRSICAEMDMYVAHWKLDTQDWVSRNTSKVYKKIMREVENGAIILCHDLYSTTADAVIQAIPELISEGYQLVTVTEMLSFHKDGIIPGTTYSRIDPENIDITK